MYSRSWIAAKLNPPQWKLHPLCFEWLVLLWDACASLNTLNLDASAISYDVFHDAALLRGMAPTSCNADIMVSHMSFATCRLSR